MNLSPPAEKAPNEHDFVTSLPISLWFVHFLVFVVVIILNTLSSAFPN